MSRDMKDILEIVPLAFAVLFAVIVFGSLSCSQDSTGLDNPASNATVVSIEAFECPLAAQFTSECTTPHDLDFPLDGNHAYILKILTTSTQWMTALLTWRQPTNVPCALVLDETCYARGTFNLFSRDSTDIVLTFSVSRVFDMRLNLEDENGIVQSDTVFSFEVAGEPRAEPTPFGSTQILRDLVDLIKVF